MGIYNIRGSTWVYIIYVLVSLRDASRRSRSTKKKKLEPPPWEPLQHDDDDEEDDEPLTSFSSFSEVLTAYTIM